MTLALLDADAMHRREFLNPSRVLAPSPVATSPAPSFALIDFARPAMATVFHVLVPWGTPNAEVAANDAHDLIASLESQLTVYRDSSEVSRLNRLAAFAPVPVETGLFDLLSLAARVTDATGGAFDITAGPLIKAWGFFRRQGRVPADDELAAAFAKVGMANVTLTPERRAVRFAKAGVEINLGGIGKGYALDRVAERLRSVWAISRALLDGGTSSILALGCPPGDPRGWEIGLLHPWQPGRRIGVVRLRDRAMASSGSTFQHFDYNNRKLGHLLDPRSGRPAEGIALAAAFAPTAAEADALATAFYVLGVEGTRDYCTAHAEAAAVLLPEGPGAEPVAFNLPPGDFVSAPAPSWAAQDSLLELA